VEEILMRIALLPDEYLPSGTRVHSKMFHELAVSLISRGHQPVVITPGSPSQSSRLLIDHIDGVEVWRFRAGYTRGVGMIRRALNEWLLPFRAWRAIKSMLEVEDFDLCINYAPTIFFGPLAKRLRLRGTYVYLIVRDMFPQWIIDEGLIREKSVAAYFFRYYEKLNYKASDCIGVQSQANLDVFSAKFPDCNNIKILRNWSATSALPSGSFNKEFLVKHSLADKVIFFYGGNTGHAQDMENIMRLAKNMNSIKEAHFLIVGQGDEFDLIHTLKTRWELDNVTILPAVSQTDFRSILAVIDIGLFSLAHNHTAHNFPGKLLGYMVESKPILGSVNPGNDLSAIIESSNAGFVYINGDDELLTKAAILLASDYNLRKEMGDNSRALLLREFTVESAVSSILNSVKRR
jgi:glycosyltransferase involved in cell wall biosynthesis